MSQPTADPIQPPASPTASLPVQPSMPARAGAPEAIERERRPGLTPVTLFLTLLIAYVLIKVQLVMILVLLSVLLATIIERPVQLLERRHVPRGLGILTVYVTMIASLFLFSVLLAPAIGGQATAFREQAPERLTDLRQTWLQSGNPLLNGPGQDLLLRGIRLIEDPSPDVSVPQDAAIGVATGIGGGIVGALTVFVITFYYLMEKSLLRQVILLEIAPGSRDRISRIWDNVEAKVGDWMRGQLTLCLAIGGTATIGYAILGVRFWPMLGLWAGITEIIPIVGPWLGGVPAVVIAMTQSWNKAFLVVGFIVLLQMLENTILVPRIMRGAVGLTPLTVFVAILAGTQFLGLPGAILAIPVAAAVQVVVTDYLDARRAAKQTIGAAPPGWRWMRGPLAPVPLRPPPVDPAETPSAPPSATAATSPPPSTLAPGWTSDVLARITRKTED